MTPTLIGLARLTAPADSDLLGRYVAARDDAAFAELVRRHGPAVLAVCRRLTRHAHDAEDAFQAVFLVLARKADRVRRGEPVAAWLYGVAVRAARNAAARTWRRRHREALVPAVPDTPDRSAEPFDPDAAAAVLDEVGRLPDFLRTAVVLCELGGRSRAAAARELGVAEGTLSSRLANARKRLAARLTARGFGPAALAVLVPVVVPRRLAAAASLVPAGRATPAVVSLARGALPTMDVRRLALVPLLAGLAAAAALAAPRTDPPPAPAPAPAPRPILAPPVGPGQLFFCWGEDLYRCDPDGKNGRVVSHPACPRDPHPDACSLSPDGTKVAYVINNEAKQARVFKVVVFAADGTGPVTDLGNGRTTLNDCWAGDSARLYVMTADPDAKTSAAADVRHEVVDVATGWRTPLALPRDHYVTDWSRDGERFLTCQMIDATGDAPAQLRTWVLNRDGSVVREIRPPAGMQAGGGKFSPDGRRVLYSAHRGPDPNGPGDLLVLDLTTGVSTSGPVIPPGGRGYHVCWSPDGRRIAYTWHQDIVEEKPGVHDPNQKIELRVIVCDADGRNATVVVTERSTAGHWSLGAIDWR